MLDLSVNFRNGFGVDFSLLPKEHGVGLRYEDDEYVLLELHYFQLLLPFLSVMVGTITEMEGELPERFKNE